MLGSRTGHKLDKVIKSWRRTVTFVKLTEEWRNVPSPSQICDYKMGKECFYTVTSLPRNRLRTKILQSERRPKGNTEGWCYKVRLDHCHLGMSQNVWADIWWAVVWADSPSDPSQHSCLELSLSLQALLWTRCCHQNQSPQEHFSEKESQQMLIYLTQ